MHWTFIEDKFVNYKRGSTSVKFTIQKQGIEINLNTIYIHNVTLERLSSTKAGCKSIETRELWSRFTKQNRRNQIKDLIFNYNKI